MEKEFEDGKVEPSGVSKQNEGSLKTVEINAVRDEGFMILERVLFFRGPREWSLCFTNDHPMLKGDRLFIRVRSGNHAPSAYLIGEVRWSGFVPRWGRYQIGCNLTDFSDANRILLSEWVYDRGG